MVGAVLQEVKVSQELKYSVSKVLFNTESKVIELVNLCTANDIHHKEWKPAFVMYRVLMTILERQIIESYFNNQD